MKNTKTIMLLIITVCIVFFITYLFFFFQKGMVFENTFLVLHQENQMNTYRGTAYGEQVTILVDGTINESKKVNISYEIGSGLKRNYSVTASNITPQEATVIVYRDDIYEFKGKYRPSADSLVVLWDNNNEPVWSTTITYNHSSPFDDSYQIGNDQIVTTAFGDNISIRGSWTSLFLAIVILSITLIDIKYPLFFFMVDHFLGVKNPEPSDLYIRMQKFNRFLCPMISMGILIAGLVVH